MNTLPAFLGLGFRFTLNTCWLFVFSDFGLILILCNSLLPDKVWDQGNLGQALK